MRSTPDVAWAEVAKELRISRSSAYALMHELGAVHVGAAAIKRPGTGALRLDRRRWLQYLSELCRSQSNDQASGLLSFITPTPSAANDVESCELQASESTGTPKPSAQLKRGLAKRKPSSMAPVDKRALDAAVAKARRPSQPPSPRQLQRRALRAHPSQR